MKGWSEAGRRDDLLFMGKFYMTEATPPALQQALHSSNERGGTKEADLLSLHPLTMPFLVWCFLPTSLFILHCLCVCCLAPASLFTAPPIICVTVSLCSDYLFTQLCRPLYFFLFLFPPLYMLPFCITLSLSVRLSFIYIVLKATGCTLVVHWCPSPSLSCIVTPADVSSLLQWHRQQQCCFFWLYV